MSQFPDGPILDYASPALKTPLRLADQSILTVREITGGVEIFETLAGKSGAIAAIIFSGGMVTLFGFCTFNTYPPIQQEFFTPLRIFYLIYLAVTLLLIVAVIESNWRETILRVKAENLVLIFKSAFKLRRYEWTTEMVRHVHVVQEIDAKTQRIVYELQIEFWSHPMVKLFTGHDPPELNDLASRLRNHLCRAVPEAVQGDDAPAQLNFPQPVELPDSHNPAPSSASDQPPSRLEPL